MKQQKTALAYWMKQVLKQCERTKDTLAPDPVHDLRTALRRTRSLIDGLQPIIPSLFAWNEVKKSAKDLFKSLSDLRDTQVMMDWVKTLAPPKDPLRKKLTDLLVHREKKLKNKARKALHHFHQKKWKNWLQQLEKCSDKLIKLQPADFKKMALQACKASRMAHEKACRTEELTDFHQLRIALKRFRYLVENFLPDMHKEWGAQMKRLQDLLGEVHDLDVLQNEIAALAVNFLEIHAEWKRKINHEINNRLKRYRMAVEKEPTLWVVWQESLAPKKR